MQLVGLPSVFPDPADRVECCGPGVFRACLSVHSQGLTLTPQYRSSASGRLWPARPAALCLPDPCGLGSDSHGGKAFSGKRLEFLTQTGSKRFSLRERMTERRCLYCLHWAMLGDDPNPEAAKREAQARHGPNVGLGGQCEYPTRTRPTGAASVSVCELWEEKPAKPLHT